jgi:hypothetical protein
MKHLRKFNESYEELASELKKLSDKMGSLKKSMYKRFTPKEIYEDYFLEFIEEEGFTFHAYPTDFLVTIQLNKKIPITPELDTEYMKSKTEKWIGRMKSTVKRLESKFDGSICHFQILLNGKIQAEQRGSNRKEDDFKFTGIGTPTQYDTPNTIIVKIILHMT